MKKTYSLIIALFICCLFAFAKEVDKNYAAQVAKNFYLQNVLVNSSAVSLNLVYECKTASNVGTATDGVPVYYVFDVSNNGGFVIVAADDLVKPVLGYDSKGRYTLENLPPALQKWMDKYKAQILYVKQHRTETTDGITQQWNDYYNNISVNVNERSAQAVSPLCQTTWDQAPYYNASCPYDNTAGANCVTGCVATAMAQIMKYWNYPSQGTGFHSYTEQNYGTLSANFGSTTYNWSSMPNSISGFNTAIATLMFHCGVAVEMNYSPQESGAWVAANYPQTNAACAENAYKTYFGYDPGIQGIPRQNYSDANWVGMIKTELDNARPVQYAGSGSGGGHTWVCDGYDQNSNFHMNWGWSGNSNGYFSIDNLDPAALGAGGGTGGFNSEEHMLIGIKPLNGGGGGGGGVTINQASIELYAATTVSANPFVTGGSFSVYADIANAGTSSFTGDFAAAVFNSSGVFMQYIQEYTNQTLQGGYHYTVTFATNALSVIPGEYIIGLYYKNGSNNYSLIGQATFTNPVSVIVTGPYSDIQMYSGTTIYPATPQINHPFFVATQTINAGGSDFTGYISADIYNLDGTYLTNIQELYGTLAHGYYYLDTFSTSGLNIAAGTYYVAFWTSTDQQNWNLIYDQNYPNPVVITIVDQPLNPDIYEADNSEATAHQLPVNISNNRASVTTAGSNIHVGNDYDYYKIVLPAGTRYAVSASVDDLYNSNNGNSYTDDVILSYKVDNQNWSDTYDSDAGTIILEDGGTVTFFVADYFQGTVGTYLLDLEIQSGATAGIHDIQQNNISLYPNPAHSVLNINAGDLHGDYSLKIFNSLGQLVQQSNSSSMGSALLKEDVSTLGAGVYILQLKTETGIANSKFIVQ